MTHDHETLAQQFRMMDRNDHVPLMTVKMSDMERITAFDDYSDTSWLELDTGDEDLNQCNRERLVAHARGDWWEIGIAARVSFLIPLGSAAVIQTITSPGATPYLKWGVESDASAAYQDELFGEERESLATILKALGVTVIDDASSFRRTPSDTQRGTIAKRQTIQDP